MLKLKLKYTEQIEHSRTAKHNSCFCITANDSQSAFDGPGGFSLGCFDP